MRFSEYFRNKKDYLLEAVAFFDFLSFVAAASVVDALALLPSEQWLFISADDVDLLQHAFPSALAQPCFASVDGFSDVAVTEVDAFWAEAITNIPATKATDNEIFLSIYFLIKIYTNVMIVTQTIHILTKRYDETASIENLSGFYSLHLQLKIKFMRRVTIVSLFVLLLNVALNAQSFFEGIITYKIDYSGESIEAMKAMMPNSYVFQFKDNNQIFKTEGGLMAGMTGDILSIGDKGLSYMIKHSEKTAYKIDAGKSKDEISPEMKPKVTKMDGKEKIGNYNCDKYEVVIKSKEGLDLNQTMWVSKELNIKKPEKTNASSTSGAFFLQEIDGFPVKIQQNIDMMGIKFTQTMTIDKVETKTLDAAQFIVPKDYKIKDFDPASMGLGGGK